MIGLMDEFRSWSKSGMPAILLSFFAEKEFLGHRFLLHLCRACRAINEESLEQDLIRFCGRHFRNVRSLLVLSSSFELWFGIYLTHFALSMIKEGDVY
ncbi:hypothetical protein CEXT_226571 [Caerostris extrusa]|uniref:Uncharacterized protein n=1 Tax=Caerostris extrusa TaxID=172846 RepID=A0AAV4Q6D4_CAEEX|nr:hypothetical protein CEXT_226571 [Caerostris extrusa]